MLTASRYTSFACCISLEALMEVFESSYLIIDPNSLVEKKEPRKYPIFLDYENYLNSLRLGDTFLDPSLFRAVIVEEEQLGWKELPDGRYLVQFTFPPIVIRHALYRFEESKKAFVSSLKGKISLGLEFSFPQLYENPQRKIESTSPSSLAEYFKKLRLSIRKQTLQPLCSYGTQAIPFPSRLEECLFPYVQKQIERQGMKLT